jgi:hypothetical protein
MRELDKLGGKANTYWSKWPVGVGSHRDWVKCDDGRELDKIGGKANT